MVDQREIKFIPRVLPVLAGTTVSFPNNDTTWHNVYSKADAKEFDLGLYPAGETRSVTFDKPGIVRILCNVHPNMEAFIVVMEHRYFSTLDKRDLVGVVSFDSDTREVVPIGPNVDPQATAGRIRSISAGGGTMVAPALGLARDRLAEYGRERGAASHSGQSRLGRFDPHRAGRPRAGALRRQGGHPRSYPRTIP